jgi:peptide/nickel transport system substrate-binding protein
MRAIRPLLALLTALGPRYGGELIVATPPGTADRLVASLVDETLLRIAPDGTLAPGLADVSFDGDATVLTLREGASFHDGRPVRAADVAASLQRFLQSPSVAGQTLFRAVLAIECLDDRRLALRLHHRGPAALAALASPAAAPPGTGPFVPTLVVSGRRASLRAFVGHVRGRPFVDTLTVVAETDTSRALDEGRVDVAVGAPGVSPPGATLVLVLDPTRPPFDSPAVRAAIDATVDRAGLAALLAPHALPASVLLMSPAPADARAAKAEGTITLAVEEGVPPLASQRVVATLGALGLTVTATARRAAEVRAATDPARLMLYVPEVNDPVLVLRELRALAAGPSNADELLDAAEREADTNARRGLLAKAELALREARAVLALIRLPVSFGARRGIHGVRLEADGRLVFEDAWREAGP